MNYARFRDQLVNANRHDLYPPEWLDAQVAAGILVPIIGERSALVVGVKAYPSGLRVGHVPAAVGDLDELRDVLAPLSEQWGRDHDCQMAMLEGRPGWSRALKGWEHHQAVLLKDL